MFVWKGTLLRICVELCQPAKCPFQNELPFQSNLTCLDHQVYTVYAIELKSTARKEKNSNFESNMNFDNIFPLQYPVCCKCHLDNHAVPCLIVTSTYNIATTIIALIFKESTLLESCEQAVLLPVVPAREVDKYYLRKQRLENWK